MFKRTNQIGISKNDFNNHIGKKIINEKQYDEIISLEDIQA